MIPELVERYEAGAITAHHLAVQCLHMVNPDDPGLVLAHLPDDILAAIEKFAAEYDPRGMNTNFGVLPVPDQVSAAMNWIGEKGSVAKSS